MSGQNDDISNRSKLTRLQVELPVGFLATTGWFKGRGYSRQLLSHYAAAGWLESPAHGVFRRPGLPLRWQHVVASLQNVLHLPVHVGGLTALELQGKGHFLRLGSAQPVHLYSSSVLPSWVGKLPLADTFVAHRAGLFAETDAPDHVVEDAGAAWVVPGIGLARITWDAYDTQITCSTLERAFLELLHHAADAGSIVHADLVLQGLTTLSPRRLAELLAACRSVRVKRLFFALAERCNHQWGAELNPDDFELGRGKRQLVRGGRLHPRFQITLPAELYDAH